MSWYFILALGAFAPILGVSFTLAFKEFDKPGFAWVVFAVAGGWLMLARRIHTALMPRYDEEYLRIRRRLRMNASEDEAIPYWRPLWFLVTVVLPFLILFGIGLYHDDAFRKEVRDIVKPVPEVPVGQNIAAAGPAHTALTWKETRELASRIWPRLVRHTVKVVMSVPPVWFVAVLLFALLRGK